MAASAGTTALGCRRRGASNALLGIGMAPYDGLVAPVSILAVAKAPRPDALFNRRIEGELPFLRRIVRRWHRDPADADDLVQDTILQALANAHLWQPGSNLRGWLFTIMRNEFLAAAAKSKRATTARDVLATAASATTTAVSMPEARLAMRDVERALRWLSGYQQTALRLVVIEGKSYEEAAIWMEMSVAAFRCHLSRARQHLKMMVDCGGKARGKRGGPGVCEEPALSPAPWPIGDAETYRAAVERPLAMLPV